METALKIVSWFAVVTGALAVIGWADEPDVYTLLGGLLFMTQGILALYYIADKESK